MQSGHGDHPPRRTNFGKTLEVALLVLTARRKSLRRPTSVLCGSRSFEAKPRGFDLGFRSAVASCPHLGGGCGIFGDVKSNRGAGSAVDKTGVLTGFRRRDEPKANGSKASPT
jgi:hypothetical protein